MASADDDCYSHVDFIVGNYNDPAKFEAYIVAVKHLFWYDLCIDTCKKFSRTFIRYLLSTECKAPTDYKCLALRVLMVNARATEKTGVTQDYNPEAQAEAWLHLGDWLDRLPADVRNEQVRDLDDSIDFANMVKHPQIRSDTQRWGEIIWAHHSPPKDFVPREV